MQPLKKFRTSLINGIPAFIAFAYRKPRKFIGEVFSKKGLNGIIGQLYNPDQSEEQKALSAAFGIFMGIIPIWGFQTLLAIFLAFALKLNKTLVVIFSQISFPPLMPLVIFLSYRAGQFWMGNKVAGIAFDTNLSFKNIGKHLEQYIYGSITLAIAAAITIGLFTLIFLKLMKALKQYKLTAALRKAL
jgi:uncharacterized protein (DUF2062 family)